MGGEPFCIGKSEREARGAQGCYGCRTVHAHPWAVRFLASGRVWRHGLQGGTSRPGRHDALDYAILQILQGAGDLLHEGGAHAAFALLGALHYRTLTGKGQYIDVSPAEAFGRCINYGLTYFDEFGETIPREGNFDVGVFPYTYFKCSDGYTFIAAFSESNFKAMCAMIDRPDLRDRFLSERSRVNLENMKYIYHEIEKWTMEHTFDEISAAIVDYNKNVGKGVVVPGRICSPADTLKEPNWWERMAFEKIDDPVYDELIITNQAWKMTETPPRVKWVCRPVGADNEKIYSEQLGYSVADVLSLKESGVI